MIIVKAVKGCELFEVSFWGVFGVVMFVARAADAGVRHALSKPKKTPAF